GGAGAPGDRPQDQPAGDAGDGQGPATAVPEGRDHHPAGEARRRPAAEARHARPAHRSHPRSQRGGTMTWSAVPRTVNRLVIDVDAPFDEFRARYEEIDGVTHFAIDQPSHHFGSFGDPDIAATGRLLDQKLAALLATLGVSVPDGLT